ncbi:hypothetical protein ATANTOWER_026645 [Ataeniobius toweri]|uniref:Uncharacterized protein n=1 Tax=Ataeniobius toweri TaxID=208326 RepID=A0ABU7AHZ6_9TELE|nr:hypothetical protein [Ataeniobius toweri]
MEDANSYTQVLSFTASLVHILATVVRTVSSVCSTCSDHRSVAVALLLDGRREVMVAALLFTRREAKRRFRIHILSLFCSSFSAINLHSISSSSTVPPTTNYP